MTRSPGWAGALSVICPGLGHLYLRAYHRAAALVAAWIALLTAAEYAGTLIPLVFAVWVFGVVDAVRAAGELVRASAEAREPNVGLDQNWAWGLIAAGALAALAATPLLRWAVRLWPLLLVLAGIRILRRRDE